MLAIGYNSLLENYYFLLLEVVKPQWIKFNGLEVIWQSSFRLNKINSPARVGHHSILTMTLMYLIWIWGQLGGDCLCIALIDSLQAICKGWVITASTDLGYDCSLSRFYHLPVLHLHPSLISVFLQAFHQRHRGQDWGSGPVWDS